MAQEKDDRFHLSGRKAGDSSEEMSKRASGVAARPLPKEPPNGGKEHGNGNGGSARAVPATRRQQYLIGTRAAGGAQAFGSGRQSMDVVVDYLGRQENIEVVRRVELSRLQPFIADGGAANEVVVARMEEGQAERLRAAGEPQIVVEPDAFLNYADTWSVPLGLAEFGAMLPLRSIAADIAIRVIGERDQPLARATVVLYGPGFPVQAVTDDHGNRAPAVLRRTPRIGSGHLREDRRRIIGIASSPHRDSMTPASTPSGCVRSPRRSAIFRRSA